MLDDVQTLFFLILNMSLTASVVIAAVLLARLALRRTPKIFSYALWAVVLFRLLCPVSIPLPVSLMGALDAPAQAVTGGMGSAVTYVSPGNGQEPSTPIQNGENGTAYDGMEQTQLQGQTQGQNAGLPQTGEQETAGEAQTPTAAQGVSSAEIAAWVWLAGALMMLGYGAAAYLRLRCKLAESVRLTGNLFLSDRVGTPFVLGLLRPKIYLPAILKEKELPYILAHERHHIRRGDHVLRLLAFLALCLHWFNPLVWAAFLLSGKDMEMSCDEAVVKKLGEGICPDYSASLLSLATGRRMLPGMPLAFGEGETSGRIRNLLSWRRPKVWITVTAAVACLAVAAACAANPAGVVSQDPEGALSGQYADVEDYVAQVLPLIQSVTYETQQGSSATAHVADVRLASLTRVAQVDGLAQEGTLETWQFSYQVRLDEAGRRTVEADGLTGEAGWFTLGSQPEMAIVLRYADGSCDVLREHSSLQGWGIWYENEAQALHDWYVTEQGLDEPRYVEDWISRLPQLRQAGYASFPARRFEGEGWSILLPCEDPFWWEPQTDGVQQYWQWNSQLSNASLSVSWMETPLEWERELLREQGYEAVDGAGLIWELRAEYLEGYDAAHRVYFCLGQDGIWRLDLIWDQYQAEEMPEVEAEPEVLIAIAESFVVAED